MKRLIGGIILFLCIAGAGTVAVLLFTGVINVDGIGTSNGSDHDAAACVSYMGSYIILDSDGMVVSTSAEDPRESDTAIPLVSGLKFSNVIIGQAMQLDNINDLNYILRIIKELKNNGIKDVSEIYISGDSEVTLYTGQVKILLGKEERVAEKISDLRDFYSDVAELSGTLDMQRVSDMNGGYTFKKN